MIIDVMHDNAAITDSSSPSLLHGLTDGNCGSIPKNVYVFNSEILFYTVE